MLTRRRPRARRRFPLQKSLFVLPNLVTLSSVFCGLYAIVIASHATEAADFHRAALLVVFAMFFDMLDGRVARLTRTQSAFGLQLDSLADVVSFGVAPALLVYELCLSTLGVTGLIGAFVFLGCGAIRLARFNVLATASDGTPAKPSKYMVGLPIPGAAGILVSLVVASPALRLLVGADRHAAFMLGATFVLSLLMVSTLPFRSFKDLKLNVRTLCAAFVVVGTGIYVSTRWGMALLLIWLLGAYVLLGIFEWMLSVVRRVQQRGPSRDSAPPPAPLD
jgi:CDP-diacylglycerol--serine O-phosphatidyltransferase